VNKTSKRFLPRTLGLLLSLLLLFLLYRQIRAQLDSGIRFEWWPAGAAAYFFLALALLPVNIGVEAWKWRSLVTTATPISFRAAFRSVLAGIAASVITPNRIGEYPGRILALKQHRSTRLISVSVLGACSQLLALMIAGVAGLLYWRSFHQGSLETLVLLGAILLMLLNAVFYFAFERWAPRIERIRAFRRIRMLARLLHRFTPREQCAILGISLLRFSIYTFQYWLLLRWQGIPLTLAGGFLLCALFFWAMAIIPTIALAEIGIRGTVSVYLFGALSGNIAGITLAVFVLWCINLVIPALAGAAVMLKRSMK
jgi:hypothetical protein